MSAQRLINVCYSNSNRCFQGAHEFYISNQIVAGIASRNNFKEQVASAWAAIQAAGHSVKTLHKDVPISRWVEFVSAKIVDSVESDWIVIKAKPFFDLVRQR